MFIKDEAKVMSRGGYVDCWVNSSLF